MCLGCVQFELFNIPVSRDHLGDKLMQQRNAARQCQSMKNIVSSAHLSTTKRTCQSETHCMQRQGKRRRLCSSHSSPVLVAEKKFGFPSAPARCHRLQRRKQRRTLDRLDRDRLDRWGSVGCLDPWTFFHLPQTCSSSSTCERDCSQCPVYAVEANRFCARHPASKCGVKMQLGSWRLRS